MALQGLGSYAERTYSPVFNVTVKAKNGADDQQFQVNAENAIVLQSYEVGMQSRKGLLDFFSSRPKFCGYAKRAVS